MCHQQRPKQILAGSRCFAQDICCKIGNVGSGKTGTASIFEEAVSGKCQVGGDLPEMLRAYVVPLVFRDQLPPNATSSGLMALPTEGPRRVNGDGWL